MGIPSFWWSHSWQSQDFVTREISDGNGCVSGGKVTATFPALFHSFALQAVGKRKKMWDGGRKKEKEGSGLSLFPTLVVVVLVHGERRTGSSIL